MLRLRNKTRSASKVGYLVKAVRGGFEYAGAGDIPVGVVTQVVPAGSMCRIQTEGEAFVYVGETITAGVQLRTTVEDEGGQIGQAYNIGDQDTYVAIGHAITHGRGLIRVSLNISASTAGGGIEEAPLTGSQYARQSGAWSIASGGMVDAPSDSVAYSRRNANWVNSNLIIDRSGGAGAATAIVNYDERLTIVGDGTYISSTYSTYVNALSQTIHQIELSLAPGALDTEWYLASADGQQATPRTVYDNRGIGNDAVVVFLDGAYTAVTQYVNTNTAFYSPTFDQAVNELTIEVDHAQLRADGYLYYQSDIVTLLSSYATQSWVTANFDDYNGWTFRPAGASDPTQEELITSGKIVSIVGDGTTIGTTWTGGNTLTISMAVTPGSMDNWYLNTDHVDSPKSIANAVEVYFIGGTGIDLSEVTWNSVDLRWEMTIANTAPSPWVAATGGINYASGNVGIGETAPTALAGDGGRVLHITAPATGSDNPEIVLERTTVGDTAAASIRITDTQTLKFALKVGAAAVADILELKSTGAVVTGNLHADTISFNQFTLSNSSDRSGLIAIEGDGTGYNGIQILADTNALWSLMGQQGNVGLYDDTNSHWAFNYFENGLIDLRHNGTVKFETASTGIKVYGSVLATGEVESYDTSDINLKDNIERLDYKFIAEEMLSSSLISYDHIVKGKREIGWIAQEIEMFLPENVKHDGEGNLMIHYGKMAVALGAVDRYQQDEIEVLQAEVKELKRKLAKY